MDSDPVGTDPVSAASLHSDVDRDIPISNKQYDNRYALVIGNEDYQRFQEAMLAEGLISEIKPLRDAARYHDFPPLDVEGKPASSGGLHAEQHFEFTRPVRPGDVLTATTKPGKSWEKESKRAGKLIFSERVTEYRDQKGELVCTARGVGVRTERPVDQK